MKQKTKLWLWALCAFLALLAFFLKFCVPGYSFSALVCCALIGILAFYELSRLLLPRLPWLKPVRRIFTVLLCIGLLAAGITEGIVIAASFGDPGQQVDYLVVLGAKVRYDGPSVSLWDRIYAAADYLEAHPGAIAVVSGGQGADEPMTEARAMQEKLVELGIEADRVWLEEQATSTWENIHFALDIIEEKTGQRPTRLGVLSSEYHLFRAGLFARANGVECVGIPAPTSRASQKINHFMREVAGIWHYLILGGQYGEG